jgi:mannan endo-1,4-beta-mannosidase
MQLVILLIAAQRIMAFGGGRSTKMGQGPAAQGSGSMNRTKKLLIALVVVAVVGGVLTVGSTEKPAVPATRDASSSARQLLRFLSGLPERRSENRVVSGFFAGYSHVGLRLDQLEQVRALTGRYPAVLGCDYGNGLATAADPTTLIDYGCNGTLRTWWESGGLVAISLHLPTPGTAEGGGMRIRLPHFADLTDAESEVGRRWRRYLDKIADGLAELESGGVPVLFRPLHEMNGDAFWWSGQDPRLFRQVWREMFDYLTRDRGLKNLLWVYSPAASHERRADYYAGPDYVDVVGLDAYDDDPLNADIRAGYEELAALDKPFALTEVGPDDANRGLADYVRWIDAVRSHYTRTVYILAWNDDWGPQANPNGARFMGDPWMITRDEVPRGSLSAYLPRRP